MRRERRRIANFLQQPLHDREQSECPEASLGERLGRIDAVPAEPIDRLETTYWLLREPCCAAH